MASTSSASTSAAAAAIGNDRKLSDIFDEAFHIYNGLDHLDMQCNSPEFQNEVLKCTTLLEDATRLVSMVGLFSDNETEDEIATEHLKYLLMPYFLGQLMQKRVGGDRTDMLRVSDVYFKDFLARCETYGLHTAPGNSLVPARASTANGTSDQIAELTQMAHQRNTKLEQYRAKKELDEEIHKIRTLMEHSHIDDTLRRDFYLKLVRSCCIEANNELGSLATEREMLHMISVAGPELHSCKHRHAAPPPLKPVIITKDAFQKAVYGAGYPSLPTMSVDEFYENRVAEGIFPDPTKPRDPNSVQARAMRGETTELDEQEEIKKEEDEENDDEMYLARARNMDEFKDEVRRGDGNRHNRS